MQDPPTSEQLIARIWLRVCAACVVPLLITWLAVAGYLVWLDPSRSGNAMLFLALLLSLALPFVAIASMVFLPLIAMVRRWPGLWPVVVAVAFGALLWGQVEFWTRFELEPPKESEMADIPGPPWSGAWMVHHAWLIGALGIASLPSTLWLARTIRSDMRRVADPASTDLQRSA